MGPLKMIAHDLGAKAAALVVMGTAGLLGVGWLSFALYYALEDSFGRSAAAALTGLCALAPLALFGLYVQLRPAPSRRDSVLDDLRGTDWRGLVAGFASTIQTLAKTHPLEALIMFLLIGFTAARRPSQLLDLVMAFAGPMGQPRPESPDGRSSGS